MRIQPKDSYLDNIILCDTDIAIPLPNPLAGGGPLAVGAEFQVVDNMLTAAAHNITITGPIGSISPTATATITTNGGSQTFVWTGGSYTAAIA
jgi:hypothetical protein